MSQALVWQLVRSNNCFVQRRGSVTFSKEVGNVANIHSYKYSGLASAKGVDAQPVAGGGAVVYTKEVTAENASKPKLAVKTRALKKSRRKAIATAAKWAAKTRPDLESAVVAKVSSLTRTSGSSGKPTATPAAE